MGVWSNKVLTSRSYPKAVVVVIV